MRALHAAGARVVIADLLDDDAGALAAELGDRALARPPRRHVRGELGGRGRGHPSTAFGTVDVLVNNAGIANAGPIDHYPLAKWDAVIAVNLTGVFLGVQAVVPDDEGGRPRVDRQHLVGRGHARRLPACTATWPRSSACAG